MRRLRRQLTIGFIGALAVLGTLTATGSSAPPSCDLSQLQLRDATINQGLGSYDRLVRGKETLVRMYFSMPSCHDNNDSIQITGGTLSATGGGATLADGIVGTPSPVSTFPTAATYAVAPLNDAPADVKFVVPGSNLAPASTTDSYTASFTGRITFRTKSSATAPQSGELTRTFTAFRTKTVERRTNALRILVVPMGNPANPYGTEFPSTAVAAIENGMQTLSRLFPVPSGVTTLGASSGGIRYAIDSTLLDLRGILNADGKLCGTQSNFNTIKGQLAQFLVSWNAANPGAPADRVVGAVASEKSLGSASSCAEGMASVVSPEAWVRAIPDAAAPSNTGALLAMELGHTFGLVPSGRSFGSYHSLNSAADGTSPNRGYNLALRSFLTDDRTAMFLSGTWNNNTTLLEKEDYAYLLCALGGAVTSECTTSSVAGTLGGVPALPINFAATGVTDDTANGTEVQESFQPGMIEEFGTVDNGEYRLVQRAPGGSIVRSTGVRVALDGSVHDEDGELLEHPSKKTFAFVVPALDVADSRFELWKGAPDQGTLLWFTVRTANGPTITSFDVSESGAATADNYTNTANVDETQPSLTIDGEWVAYSKDAFSRTGGNIYAGPRSDSANAVPVPKPALLGFNGPIVFSSNRDGNYELYTMDEDGSNPIRITNTPNAETAPAWLPDNSGIVYVRDGNIWVLDAGGATQLTTEGGADPSVAPDGRIAFISSRNGGAGGEVYVMNKDGSGQTRLTNNAVTEQDPAWSPQNDLIAFATLRDGPWRLYSMAPDGSGQAAIPGTQDGDIHPAFSPDGEKIAYFRAACCTGVDGDLGYMNLDGTGRVQLTNTTPELESDPSWSGDATKIVFRSRADDTPTDPTSVIQVIDIATGGRTVLTNGQFDDTDPSWGVIRDGIEDPAWSQSSDPANSAMAYISGGDIYTVSADLSGAFATFGSPELVYDTDGFGANSPTWNQDGTEIAFVEASSESSNLNVLDLGDPGGVRNVTFSSQTISSPSWSRTAGDDRIAYQQQLESGTEIRAIGPSAGATSSFLTSGRSPSWGTDGRIAFTDISDGSDIWLFEDGQDNTLAVENGFDADLVGDRLAFVRSIPCDDVECTQADVMLTTLGGTGLRVEVEVTDPDSAPGDLRLDLLADCGDLVYVAAVALAPDEEGAASASWATNFDPSLTCENPKLKVAVSDGYNRTGTDTGDEIEVEAEQKPPTAAIYAPAVASVFRQYDSIPARGSGWDAEAGALSGVQLQWKLTRDLGGFTPRTGSGAHVDFSPTTDGGFQPGMYTLELTVTDEDQPTPHTHTVTRKLEIVGDADNDGLTDAEEGLSCIADDPVFVEPSGYNPALDPLNAFRDGDRDGIPNVDDPALCTPTATYEAIVDVDANMVKSQPLGVVTGYVTLRNRPATASITQVDGSTVKISSINGIPANISALRWSVDKNGVGVSKYDKAKIIEFLNAHNIGNGPVLITISGTATTGWTFEGSDTTNVH